MARDLSNSPDVPIATDLDPNGDVPPAGSAPLDPETIDTLIADAYSLAVAVGALVVAYWALFRPLPGGVAGPVLAVILLVSLNVYLTVRG